MFMVASAQKYQMPQSQRVQAQRPLRLMRPMRNQCDVTNDTISSAVVNMRDRRAMKDNVDGMVAGDDIIIIII